MQYNIYNIIDLIRPRPTLYIHPCSTYSMNAFLTGYCVAMQELGAEDVSTPKFFGFNDWVQKKLGYYESTAGWANMILAHTLGFSPNHSWETILAAPARWEQNTAALENFFELLDEYRKT